MFHMFFVSTSILNVCLLLTHCYWRSAHVLYVIRLNCGMRGCGNAPYILFNRIFSFPMGGMSAKHFPKIVSKLPCHSTEICFPIGLWKLFLDIISKLLCHFIVICFRVSISFIVQCVFLTLLHLFLLLQREHTIPSDDYSISHWRNVCKAFTKDGV